MGSPAGPYEYIPETFGLRGTPGKPVSETEYKRVQLQRRAEKLIRDTIAPYNQNPDLTALAPAVMRALDQGGKDPDVATAIKRRIGADKVDAARIEGTKADFQPGGPAKPGATPANPGGTPAANADPIANLESGLRAYASSMPDPSHYKNPDGTLDDAQYRAELADWFSAMGEMQKTLTGFREARAGITKLADGTIVTQDAFDKMDPMAQAQVRQFMQSNNDVLTNAYNKTMNDIGLTEYALPRDATKDANAIKQARFANTATAQAGKIAYDTLNTDRATKELNRELSGRADSYNRTKLVTDTMAAAAPWATGGKTEFTGNDFGGLLSGLLQQSNPGSDRNAVALRFPSSIRLDPQGLLAANDAAAGVGGRLPVIPQLISMPADAAAAPSLLDMPNTPPPVLRRPNAPTLVPMPGGGSIVGAGLLNEYVP